MKRGVAKLRLSPNEEAQLIREEKERRRKLRIQQVREQQKLIAWEVRQNVERRRHSELEQLEEELREEWERERSEKLLALQALYEQSLQLVGQGQRMAKENEPDLVAIAQKEAENHMKAAERFRGALCELKSQKLKEREMQNRTINARKKALQMEKARSAKVASLPAPQPHPILNIVPERPHVGKKSDISAFASSRYHMPTTTVDREEDTQQINASREAELAMRRLQDFQRDNERKRAEQQEKARLRGKSALRKEHLALDHERLLVELQRLQQADMLRRRQQVSQMPPQIFQPLYKRQEMKDDFQKEMEFAFEDMYTGERKIKGDLVSQLVPEPLPEVSTSGQDHELDVTLEEPTTSEPGHQEVDRKEEAQSAQQEESAYVEPQTHVPKKPLKKLLDRIRNQRNQPTRHGSRVPASRSPSTVLTQVPERDTTVGSEMIPGHTTNLQQVPRRDTPTELEVVSEQATTIDTGSLSSQPLLVEHRKPTKPLSSASSMEPTGQPIPADALSPDELSPKIMNFEEEQKQRHMELEMEKQQQLELLKELDDQKAQLEQVLLLEAQQDGGHATVPVHVQEPHGPELPPVDEDEHVRRIRDYQKRLLEQNRTHKMSVEVARQRLEEYQRALQMRHNTDAVSLPPPDALHPPVHSSQHARIPTPPLLPAASAVPARISDDPQTSMQVASKRSAGPGSPPSIPSTSSSLQAREVASSSNSSRNLILNGDSLLSSSVIPSQPVSRDLTPPLAVTREIIPPHMITREPLPPKPVTRELLPQAVTTESVIVPSLPFQQPTDPIPTVRESGVPLPSSQKPESPGDDVSEWWRRHEVQMAPHERRQVEEDSLARLGQRQEDDLQLLRQQKETLQALINVEAQPPSEVLPPEDTGQTRIKLLASLLQAIEKSNRRSSPPKEEEGPHHQAPSTSVTAMLPPARATKPPVTRVWLGTTMKEQHELSAIQEVETPVDTSQVTGPEDVFSVPQHTIDWSLQEQFDSSVATEPTLQTASTSSSGQQSAETPISARTDSTGSRLHLNRQRLPTETGATPDSSEYGSHCRISSDSGRGADYLGPALTTHGSPADNRPPGDATLLSAHGPPELDSFSTTTLSTGSYITSETEANGAKSPALSTMEPTLASHFLGSPTSLSDSPAADPSHTTQLASLFRDSNVQRIIDRYTKELDVSFSTAGRSTDSEGSCLVEPPPSDSQQSLHQVPEGKGEDDEASEVAHTAKPILEQLSVTEGQDSFRSLIGQLADQSSCLVADHKDGAMEQLVGQPSAHSSMIRPLPGLPLSSGIYQNESGFTSSRQVSQQSSDCWLRSEQDLLANQLTSQMQQSTSWLYVHSESSMRPLVGELDVSSGQHSSSSGERTCTDLGALTEATVPSYPSLPPEASSHSTVPGLNPLLQNQPSALEAGSQHNEGADSFHPLPAELTHDGTENASVIFHVSDPDTQNSSKEQLSSGELSVFTHSDFQSHDGESDSEEPTESLRAEDDSYHEATSLLVVSVLMSPTAHFSHSSASDTLSTSSILVQEDVEQPEASVPRRDLLTNEPKDDQSLNLRGITAKLLEATTEKGILEQSQITLLSLTDTTLQDSIMSEEEGMWEEALTKEGGKGQEESEATITEGSSKVFDIQSPTHAGTLLEFNWGPSRDLQGVFEQKRKTLLERSTRRAEELKARAALFRTGQPSKVAVEHGEESEEHPSVLCKAKTLREVPHDTKSNTAKSTLNKQRKSLPPEAVSMSMLHNPTEVRKGKQDPSEMHRRTQRLYEQLEEVKQQKDIRSRQEAYAKNRAKAKAFHMKTLQKLRAKQTRR